MGVVLLGEVAALQQARLHRAEIIQADGGRQHNRRLVRGLRLIALNEDASRSALAGGKWRVSGQRGRLQAGQAAHSLDHLSLQLTTALTVVLLQPRIEGDFDGLLGIEAEAASSFSLIETLLESA